MLALLAGTAAAHEGDDPISKWYQSLGRSDVGSLGGRVGCCSMKDCAPTKAHLTYDGWTVPDEHGNWVHVPENVIIYTKNPIGDAVVCWNWNTEQIRCFVPPNEG